MTEEFSLGVFYPVLPYRSIGDESYSREIFEEYITYLKEKAKEKERKREEEKVHNFICHSFWFHKSNIYTCFDIFSNTIWFHKPQLSSFYCIV